MLSLPLGRHLASSETSPSDAVDAVVSVAGGREQSVQCRHSGPCSAAGLQAEPPGGAGSVQGGQDVLVRARGPRRALTHGDIRVFSTPDRFSVWSPMGSGLTCRQWKGFEDFLPFCQASQQCRSPTATFYCLFSLFAACFLFLQCPSTSPRQPPSVWRVALRRARPSLGKGVLPTQPRFSVWELSVSNSPPCGDGAPVILLQES